MKNQVANRPEPQEASSQPLPQVSQIEVTGQRDHSGGLVGGLLAEALGEGRTAASIAGIEYLFPRVCCRCGNEEGTEHWNVSFSKKETHLFSSTTTTYTFKVPVCASCHGVLEKLSKRSLKAGLIGAVLGGVTTFVTVGILFEWRDMICPVVTGFLGAIIGAYIGYLVGGSAGLNLGQYDGKYFRFKNSEFQRQFAELNPHLMGRGDILIGEKD